jgi:hypothetical protein
MYIALQNENGISYDSHKKQMTMSYGGRHHKWQSLQAGILKNCGEWCKMILYCSAFSCRYYQY